MVNLATINGDFTAEDGIGLVSFTLSDYDQEGGAELLGRLYTAMVREMSPPTGGTDCWSVVNNHA